MRYTDPAREQLHDGFLAIHAQFGLPMEFPDPVSAAAEQAAAQPVEAAAGRRDATDLPLVTLDPASSTDLDQAFALAEDGSHIVLSYALADIGFFAPVGGAVEQEAWKRGVTVYAPDRRVPVYPEVLSGGAASLLPAGPRPAILLTVAIAPDGTCVLRACERVVCASRAKLAYETTDVDQLPPLLIELGRRMRAAEEARGAESVQFPQQEVEADAASVGGVRLVLRPRRDSEDLNSFMSLAANFAVAALMLEAKVGLFRVMADPPPAALAALRRAARALGINWPDAMSLRQLAPILDLTKPTHADILLSARRAGGRASYATYDPATLPWHSALGATYAHATAPMRRLADRYVLELVGELVAGHTPSSDLRDALDRLPETMSRADTVAAKVDGAVIDLVEAVAMAPRVGETFDAEVVDTNNNGATVQLLDPAVRARVVLRDPIVGQRVKVVLVEADPVRRLVRLRQA